MESSEERPIPKQPPFDFKIKALKRYLREQGMPKAELNKTVRLYKERVYTRVEEVKAKIEAENAKKKKGTLQEAIEEGDERCQRLN